MSWAPPRTPLAVSRRVGDDTLRPERSREAVTCRVTGLREVIMTAPNCLYHAARPLGKLPVNPREAALQYHAAYTRMRSMNTSNFRMEVWSARMEV